MGFLPEDHGCCCEAHPHGCGNALIEKEGSGEGRLVHLRLIEKTHLVGHKVQDNGSDGCRVCFAACEYATGGNANFLDGSLLRITRVVLPDCESKSMRALYHHNSGYAYAETIEN